MTDSPKPENPHPMVVISAYTGTLLCDDFNDLQVYIEKIMGRPVYTHEMGSQAFMDEVKRKTKDYFTDAVTRLNKLPELEAKVKELEIKIDDLGYEICDLMDINQAEQ